MHPTWFKLLIYYRYRGPKYGFSSYGLTFPFLIGALRVPVGSSVCTIEENKIEILSLLNSMRDETPNDYNIHITKCDRVGVVASPSKGGLKHPTTGSIFSTHQYLTDEERGVNSIADSIWNECGQQIIQGNFSNHSRTFSNFTDPDLQLINDALSPLNDDLFDELI